MSLIYPQPLNHSDTVPCPSSQCDRGYEEGAPVFDSSGEPSATYIVCPTCRGMGIVTRAELREYIMERLG